METHQYKIREGTVAEVLSQSRLLEKHWDEVAKNKHLMQLNPIDEEYYFIEDSGNSITLIGECDDKIVGYSCSFIRPHLHYRDLMCCYNDVIFVDDSFRKSTLGLRLIKDTEKLARKRGCNLMFWHAKFDTNLFKIMPALKYKPHEAIFSKEL